MVKHRPKPNIASPLDELGMHPDPKLLPTDYLDAWKESFEQDRTTTYAAFMALSSVAAYWWQHQDDPPEHVEVPWWALQAIAIGFQSYTHDQDEGR